MPPELGRYVEANGLRKVVPYCHRHKMFAKRRWLGMPLLDVFLTEYASRPATYYRAAIEAGLIAVNGARVGCAYALRDSDCITHDAHRHEPPVAAGPVRVLHRDADVLVVDKPASLPCHPCGAFTHNSVHHVLAHQEEEAALHARQQRQRRRLERNGGNGRMGGIEGGAEEEEDEEDEEEEENEDQEGDGGDQEKEDPSSSSSSSLSAVHRLDRLVSGVLVFARHPEAAKRLSGEIARGEVTKTYVARVLGRFPGSRAEAEHALGRRSENLDAARRQRNLEQHGDQWGAAPQTPLADLCSVRILEGPHRAGDAEGPCPPPSGVDRVAAVPANAETPAALSGDLAADKKCCYGGGSGGGRPLSRAFVFSCPLGLDRGRLDGAHAAVPVCDGGRESATVFEVLATNGAESLVACRPRTGRTHQIRLHLQALGCPIANDPLYAADTAPGGPPCRGRAEERGAVTTASEAAVEEAPKEAAISAAATSAAASAAAATNAGRGSGGRRGRDAAAPPALVALAAGEDSRRPPSPPLNPNGAHGLGPAPSLLGGQDGAIRPKRSKGAGVNARAEAAAEAEAAASARLRREGFADGAEALPPAQAGLQAKVAMAAAAAGEERRAGAAACRAELMRALCACCRGGDAAAFSAAQLRRDALWLHALAYSGPNWAYSAPLPSWASLSQ